MDRLTVADEKIEGGTRRAVIDARAVREEAMTIYWQLKKYEDLGLEPSQIAEIDRLYQAKCEEVVALKKELAEIEEEKLNEAYDLGYQSCLRNKGMKWDEAEELQRYREKIADGRMVELPCNIGDVVFVRKSCLNDWYTYLETKEYVKAKVINFKITSKGIFMNLKPLTERTMCSRYHMFFSSKAFGRTVFKTEEEAEQSLEESGDSNVPL